MNLFDHFDIPVEELDSDLGLFYPVSSHSVAGILPTLLDNFNFSSPFSPTKHLVSNQEVETKVKDSFPQGYDNVVFVVVDGIGVWHLSQLKGLLWDNITTQGTIASSCFPTMTSTVMTSLSYGLNPADHGLLGYNIYNEHLDAIWNALNVKYKKGGEERFVLDDVELASLVKGTPLVDLITSHERVPITFLIPEQLVSPGLDSILSPSLPAKRYSDLTHGLHLVSSALGQNINNQIIVFYIPYADQLGHYHGPDTQEYSGSIKGIEMVLQQILGNAKLQDGSTLMAVTSDHGQVQVDHSVSTWMDRKHHRDFMEQGITLSTSGRVIHAYCQSHAIGNGKELLENFARGRGLVISNQKAMELAGGNMQFSQRMGEWVLLMEDGYLYDVPETVQYGEEAKLHGQHGSLTEKELFVPVGIFGGENNS